MVYHHNHIYNEYQILDGRPRPYHKHTAAEYRFLFTRQKLHSKEALDIVRGKGERERGREREGRREVESEG